MVCSGQPLACKKALTVASALWVWTVLVGLSYGDEYGMLLRGAVFNSKCVEKKFLTNTITLVQGSEMYTSSQNISDWLQVMGRVEVMEGGRRGGGGR